MKKSLLFILCSLTALCGMAQTSKISIETFDESYVVATKSTTGQLVSPTRYSDPIQGTERLVMAPKSSTFTLYDFRLPSSSGGAALSLGDIALEGVSVRTGVDGLSYITYEGTFTFDLSNLSSAMQTQVGESLTDVPMTFNGKYLGDKLYGVISFTIKTTSGKTTTRTAVDIIIGTDDFSNKHFTETYTVTADGETSEPADINVDVVENGDGTADVTLHDFVISISGASIPVSSITLENVEAEKDEDGLTHLSYNGTYTIPAEMLPTEYQLMASLFKDLPLTLEGKYDDDKFYATMDITVRTSIVNIDINVVIGSDTFGTILGDVNGDNSVDIADAVSVLNVMAEGSNDPKANVNGDDTVDIADFVSILNIMAEM